eukprot:g3817.t1
MGFEPTPPHPSHLCELQSSQFQQECFSALPLPCTKCKSSMPKCSFVLKAKWSTRKVHIQTNIPKLAWSVDIKRTSKIKTLQVRPKRKHKNIASLVKRQEKLFSLWNNSMTFLIARCICWDTTSA